MLQQEPKAGRRVEGRTWRYWISWLSREMAADKRCFPKKSPVRRIGRGWDGCGRASGSAPSPFVAILSLSVSFSPPLTNRSMILRRRRRGRRRGAKKGRGFSEPSPSLSEEEGVGKREKEEEGKKNRTCGNGSLLLITVKRTRGFQSTAVTARVRYWSHFLFSRYISLLAFTSQLVLLQRRDK